MTDFIVVGIVVVILACIAVYYVRRKKAGKSACGCGCDGCSSSAACHSDEQK
ncbi:MAG: FeoB-associated Cys-rich membrane protein [Mobilitalea sp.]